MEFSTSIHYISKLAYKSHVTVNMHSHTWTPRSKQTEKAIFKSPPKLIMQYKYCIATSNYVTTLLQTWIQNPISHVFIDTFLSLLYTMASNHSTRRSSLFIVQDLSWLLTHIRNLEGRCGTVLACILSGNQLASVGQYIISTYNKTRTKTKIKIRLLRTKRSSY